MLRQVFGDSEPEGLEQDQSGVDASRVRDREELSGTATRNPDASRQVPPDGDQETGRPNEADQKKSKADNILSTGDSEGDAAGLRQAAPLPRADAVAERRHGGAKPV